MAAQSKLRKQQPLRQRFTSISRKKLACFNYEWGEVINNKQHRKQVAQFLAYRLDYVDNAFEPETSASRVDLDLKSIDQIRTCEELQHHMELYSFKNKKDENEYYAKRVEVEHTISNARRKAIVAENPMSLMQIYYLYYIANQGNFLRGCGPPWLII